MTGGRSTVAKISAVADPFQPVIVKWADAHAGEGSWHTLDENEQDEHIVSTCGWLIPEHEGGKPGHVTVAQNVDPQELVDHVLFIPGGMVRTITYLQPFTGAVKK